MIKKILAAIKGDPESLMVLRYAAKLAKLMGAELTAIHVLSDLHAYPFLGSIDELRREEIRQEKESIIEDIKEACEECQLLEIRTKIVEGVPAKMILTEKRRENYDLIVVGSHESKAMEFLMGGVGVQIVHHSRIPIIVVKKFREFSKILMCTDGSGYAENAIRFAGDIAKKADSRVTILCVVPEVAKGREEPAKMVLKIGQEILERKGKKAEAKIRHGNPAEEILQESMEGDYDLIVMGSKGKSAVEELLLGDVASLVVHHSTRPTLIFREKPEVF